MEDHRRNAWYVLGAVPLTAGGALAVEWLIAVDSSTAKVKPSYWGVPSYVAMGLLVLGVIIIRLIMAEKWFFGFRKFQHEKELGRTVPPFTASPVFSNSESLEDNQDFVQEALDAARGISRSPRAQSERRPGSIRAGDDIQAGGDLTAQGDIKAGALSTKPVKREKTERKLGARKNIPDFANEIRRFQEIDRIFDDSEEAKQDVENWIQDVREKLEGWIPRNAQRFMDESPMDAFAQILSAQFVGRPDFGQYPELARLHRFRVRLRNIVDQ